jgi:hypothetical protein
MRTRNVLAAAVAATAAGFLALGPTPASAVPVAATAPMNQGPDALVLSVAKADPQNQSGVEQAVTLSCTPTAEGTHPDATAACDSLIDVGGDIAGLPAANTLCPMIYLPVTATAVGVWNGRQLSYHRTFTNQCVMLRATGEVFNL